MSTRMFAPILALAAMLAAGRAEAMTAEGTLITNLASATLTPYSGNATGVISYGVTANVLVVNPTLILQKVASPTLQATSGTVTFCITFSNSSDYVSAFGIVIRDVMPPNMSYVPGAGNDMWADDPTAPSVQWSPTGGAAPIGWVAGYSGSVQGPTSTFRWAVPVLGPGRSGYVCYMATVQ